MYDESAVISLVCPCCPSSHCHSPVFVSSVGSCAVSVSVVPGVTFFISAYGLTVPLACIICGNSIVGVVCCVTGVSLCMSVPNPVWSNPPLLVPYDPPPASIPTISVIFLQYGIVIPMRFW